MNLFEQINDKKAELDRMIQEFGEQAIKEYLREFWEKNPTIKSIKWQQYTPYFNDGDACEFSVYEVGGFIEGLSEPDDGDYEDGHLDSWSIMYKYWDKISTMDRDIREDWITEKHPEYAALKKLNEIWSNNEIALLSVFGDHVQITADRDKIQVEEHSHD